MQTISVFREQRAGVEITAIMRERRTNEYNPETNCKQSGDLIESEYVGYPMPYQCFGFHRLGAAGT